MKRNVAAGMAMAWLAAAALAVCGCNTTRDGGVAAVQVTMAGDDLFEVGRRSAKLAELPALLKKNGAGPATEVIVVVSETTPGGAISAIGGKLSSAGYRKVVFRKPRHAESFAGPDAGRRK